ncbi:MAG: NAD(P)/FAD-dependent oxidoreductase, partial [Streptosporangiaceae bacterium]
MIIGAGPAGLACALHLARLIQAHNRQHPEAPLSTENIYVLEKGRSLGAHQLSGAVMDPRGLLELEPDFAADSALGAIPVRDDALLLFFERGAARAPITPPPLHNHGNYIISVNRLAQWLGAKVEAAGVNVFTSFAGVELLFDGPRLVGVRTDDKGVGRDRRPKSNFEPGYDLKTPILVLAEGPRGSLTKDLVHRLKLDGLNPQVYGLGIKELWDVQPGRIATGYVAHTLGWPLGSTIYGGGWVYGMRGNRVSLGMVVALEYHDPLFDP